MPSIANVARSSLRIARAVSIVGILGLAAFAIVLRQPTLTTLPFRGSERADPTLLHRHVDFLTNDVRPRNSSHPENLDRAAAYIANHFEHAHGETALQTFTARRRPYANVIGHWGPRDPRLPLLVVGAHYDSFGDTGALPGADDNASGTAGLLELARLLGSQKLALPVALVAFTTEEPPFFGSDQMGSAIHANSLVADRRNVRGMICLEMIGYFSNEQAWPNALFAMLYPSRGDFVGVVGGWHDRQLARLVKRAIAGAGPLPAVSFTGPRETSDASDQRNYWSRGWSAVMVTDTAFLRNPNYHTARDTANTLDYERMAHVIDGVLNAVLHETTR
jgi:hypothetical protein